MKKKLQKQPTITLKVNGLTTQMKRYRVSEGVRKQDRCICCPQETHFRLKEIQTESQGMKNMFHANGDLKKGGVVIQATWT